MPRPAGAQPAEAAGAGAAAASSRWGAPKAGGEMSEAVAAALAGAGGAPGEVSGDGVKVVHISAPPIGGIRDGLMIPLAAGHPGWEASRHATRLDPSVLLRARPWAAPLLSLRAFVLWSGRRR